MSSQARQREAPSKRNSQSTEGNIAQEESPVNLTKTFPDVFSPGERAYSKLGLINIKFLEISARFISTGEIKRLDVLWNLPSVSLFSQHQTSKLAMPSHILLRSCINNSKTPQRQDMMSLLDIVSAAD
ncbi:hypothetical protein EAG_00716 [Camponotus floridanus]|uniref:Uncharacterized protein n=1 Tax=Camponotus floridanus TaxID=104421 RepID=E2AU64_CAMFO|nr:hypothetical protein EAG_00716 [Camponotus floridanus]